MAVALPALPKEAEVTQRYLDFSGLLTPALGGASQQIGRLGSRLGLDVTMPPLDQASARAWIARRLRAKAEQQTLTLAWPQPAFTTGGGAPKVDGANQLGTLLNVKGFPAGLVLLEDTFFSFVANSRHYLHVITAQATMDGAGKGQLHIAPMLRRSPADSADLEFAAPVIEGFLDGNTVAWTLKRLSFYGMSFALTENE